MSMAAILRMKRAVVFIIIVVVDCIDGISKITNCF